MPYDLQTVREVYSYWGKSKLFYEMGVSFFGTDRWIRRRAVKSLRLKKGSVVVDLACGPGNMLKLLEREVGPSGRIIAVDYVDEMTHNALQTSRRNRWQNVTIVRCDAARLRLEQDSADGVICVLGLSAIPDHVLALRQAKRILKKGGRLVVLDGKDFSGKLKILNPLLRLLRWDKSYERKDVLSDIRAVFGNARVEESFLGSTFISVSLKKN